MIVIVDNLKALQSGKKQSEQRTKMAENKKDVLNMSKAATNMCLAYPGRIFQKTRKTKGTISLKQLQYACVASPACSL